MALLRKWVKGKVKVKFVCIDCSAVGTEKLVVKFQSQIQFTEGHGHR